MNNTFSPYMLKTFDECKKKFFFLYIENLYLPSKENTALSGEKIHLLANYFLKKQIVSPFEKTLNKDELILWNNFKKNEILKMTLLATEYDFSVRLGEDWLKGRIDAIFKDNNKIIIADWKTGREIAETVDYQSMLYLFAVYNIFKKKGLVLSPEQVEFVYFYLKNNTVKKIIYSQIMHEQNQNFLTTKIQEIKNNKSYAKLKKQNNSMCYTCNFKSLCYISQFTGNDV